MILDKIRQKEVGQENTILQGTSKMYDPLGISQYVATTSQSGRFYLRTNQTLQRRLKQVRVIDVPVVAS